MEKAKTLRAFASSREPQKEEAKPARVPKLRFPGFTKRWDNAPLAKTLTEHKLKNTAGRDVFSVSMESGIVNQIEHLGRSFAAADTSHYSIGRRYDVVYTKSPLKAFPFGIVKQCKFDGEVALSPLYGVFTPSNPHVGLLIEAYFESPNRSVAFLTPLCQKGAKNTIQITNSTFLSGKVPLPTEVAEQQKIAECLSSVDEVIAAQARKLDALKTQKKGLMQQLFPREGETQPRLRFPEFKNAGEWTEDALGNVCAVLNNRRRPITSRDRKPGPYRYYGASGVVDYVDDFIFDERVVLVGEDGAKWGAFERTAFIVEGKFWVNNHAHVLKPHGVNDALLESFLTMADLAPFVTGAAPPKLTLGKLKEIPVPIPPNEKEGEAIARCLSSLDARIAAEAEKLEALKTHKRGLMQQLFPSPEEVAG